MKACPFQINKFNTKFILCYFIYRNIISSQNLSSWEDNFLLPYPFQNFNAESDFPQSLHNIVLKYRLQLKYLYLLTYE